MIEGIDDCRLMISDLRQATVRGMVREACRESAVIAKSEI
jgi:hypothetical protein